MDPTTDELISWLNSDSHHKVRETNLLANKGPEVVPALIKALHSEKEIVRSKACSALREMGPRAQEAIPDLVEMMVASNDDNWVEGKAAGSALGAIGPAASPRLIALAMGGDSRSSRNAIEALGRMRPPDEGAVQALIQLSRHQDARVRVNALSALNSIAAAYPAAVEKAGPDLIQHLKDPAANVRMLAAAAIGYIRLSSHDAARALIVVMEDPDPMTASVAVNALERIGTVESMGAAKRYRLSQVFSPRAVGMEMLGSLAYGLPFLAGIWLVGTLIGFVVIRHLQPDAGILFFIAVNITISALSFIFLAMTSLLRNL